jgi:DNA-binding HxlR family transcriptional regulator
MLRKLLNNILIQMLYFRVNYTLKKIAFYQKTNLLSLPLIFHTTVIFIILVVNRALSFVILRTILKDGSKSVKMSKYSEKQTRTAQYAKALAHPARIAILELLSNQSCCYHGDMAEELPIAKSTISQHLNELKKAGLIQGDITPPSVKYCINKENWNAAKLLLDELMKHS